MARRELEDGVEPTVSRDIGDHIMPPMHPRTKKKAATTKKKAATTKKKSKETVVIKGEGKTPLTFKKGALHEQLGVSQGEPIPTDKKKAALRGDYGPLAKKRAVFAFKGALAKGRKTAAKGK